VKAELVLEMLMTIFDRSVTFDSRGVSVSSRYLLLRSRIWIRFDCFGVSSMMFEIFLGVVMEHSCD